MVSIEQNENSLADITFLIEGNEPDYVFEDCCPVDNLLLFEIYADNQVIYISLVQDVLGHSDFSTVMDVYTTVTNELKQREFDSLQEKMNQQKCEREKEKNSDKK